MRAIWLIAKATFHEAWRRRFLNGILVFGILIIGSSWTFTYLQPGAELKMLIDTGLGAIRFFGMLIAIFLGVRLIPDELEKQTIHTLLAKPVTRAQFMLGKFFGGVATVFANVALMGITFFIVYTIKASQFQKIAAEAEEGATYTMIFMSANIAKAIGLAFFELTVLVGIAVLASILFSWILGAIFSFFIYFVGQMADFLRELSSPEHGADPVSSIIFGVLYRILPHFEIFDIREKILMDDLVPWSLLGNITAQAIIYIVVILMIGYLVFNEREV